MLQIGDLVWGRYKILDLIGVGGEATIALALDTQTNQRVVVKKLDADPRHSHFETHAARFRRAGRLSFNHPGAVDPIAYFEENDRHFLIMPFVEGETLELHVKKRGGKLPTEEATRLAGKLAEILDVIHTGRVIHRDLKPANIMVRPDGNPVIIDFGICRMVDEATITEGNGFLGSIKWTAPEQLERPTQANESADLYSLGAVFYFMLTGRPPFDGINPTAIGHQVKNDLPPSPKQIDPAIPEHADQFCLRMLAKSPAARPQNAREVMLALSAGRVASFCNSCGMRRTDGGRYCTACGVDRDQVNHITGCFACGAAVNATAVCPGCQRPFDESNHHLTFKGGALTGAVRRIPEGICIVGRPELLPRDTRISRKQLHVACMNGSVHIQDAGSRNPTRVNGHVTDQPTVLRSGDSVDIAANVAIYLCEQGECK